MANNSDLGCDGPSPDFVPDENTETVDETVDLNPMVFLSKLQKVQEHFDGKCWMFSSCLVEWRPEQ